LLFGDRLVYKEVMDEYFLETLGYLPYESLTFCMECSTKMITTLKNKNAWVPCRFHQTPRIPWEYRRINNGTGI
jgi:UDP-galactopyranose mutase